MHYRSEQTVHTPKSRKTVNLVRMTPKTSKEISKGRTDL